MTPNDSTPPSPDRRVAAIREAAGDLVSRLLAYYRTDTGIHAETVIAAAAVLFGEWSLRASGEALPPSGWIVSGGSTAVMFGGEEALWPLVAAAARRAGVAEADLPDPMRAVAQAVAAFGRAYPPLSVAEGHRPLEWSPVAGPRFREPVRAIAEARGLADDGVAIAAFCALAVALLIEITAEALDPRVAVRLALELAVGAARMAPAPVAEARWSPYQGTP